MVRVRVRIKFRIRVADKCLLQHLRGRTDVCPINHECGTCRPLSARSSRLKPLSWRILSNVPARLNRVPLKKKEKHQSSLEECKFYDSESVSTDDLRCEPSLQGSHRSRCREAVDRTRKARPSSGTLLGPFRQEFPINQWAHSLWLIEFNEGAIYLVVRAAQIRVVSNLRYF